YHSCCAGGHVYDGAAAAGGGGKKGGVMKRAGLRCAVGAAMLLGGLGAFAPAALAQTFTLFDVDTSQYAGYENSIYAADADHVFVAYKQFLQNPYVGTYIPAVLKVAMTSDGGATWTTMVIDDEAPEIGDLVENSVAIDGVDAQTVFVSYMVRSSGLFADMKLRVARTL